MIHLATSVRRRAPRAAGHRHPRSTSGFLGLAVAAAGLLTVAAPAAAASPPLSNPHIIAHLDFSRGQTPGNLALEPNGSADVTFAEAAQVARVSLDGQVRILAQLPQPTAGAACPVLGPRLRAAALTSGIVRGHDGNLYVALCTGSPDLQGIWRVSPNGSASRIAALPAGGIPNGMALDDRHGFLHVADSLLSVIWRVSITNGSVVAWAAGPQLAPNGGLGANGLKLHDGAAWPLPGSPGRSPGTCRITCAPPEATGSPRSSPRLTAARPPATQPQDQGTTDACQLRHKHQTDVQRHGYRAHGELRRLPG
jgi:hypothetical protein